MKTIRSFSLGVMVLLGISAVPAQAGGHWGVGINIGFPFYPCYPWYYRPYPVYYYPPAPVYVQPAPVYQVVPTQPYYPAPAPAPAQAPAQAPAPLHAPTPVPSTSN